MTMFIMFAALYIFALPTIQVKAVHDLPPRPLSPVGEPSPPRSAPGSILERVHTRLLDRIERDGLGHIFSAYLVPEKAVHLVLSGDAVFGPGGTVLPDEVRKSLVSLGDILRSSPHMLAVVGHAASGEPLGSQAGPWELSAVRAASVAGILMREAEIPSGRLLLAGYGDQRPAAGQAGLAASRRVELILCAETPTEPLQVPSVPAGDGFRGWLAATQQGEN